MSIKITKSTLNNTKKYNFVRAILIACNVLEEDTANKLYVVLRDLTSFKTMNIAMNDFERYTRQSEHFKSNTKNRFLPLLVKIGLLRRSRTLLIFNSILLIKGNISNLLAISFIGSEKLIRNKANGSVLRIKEQDSLDYLNFLKNTQKKRPNKDPHIPVVMSLFITDRFGRDRSKLSIPLAHKSKELGFESSFLKQKFKSLIEQGLIFKSEKHYYLNPDLISLNEYSGVEPLNRIHTVNITEDSIELSTKQGELRQLQKELEKQRLKIQLQQLQGVGNE